MAITPYNLKVNAYVNINANGSYGSSLNKTTNKATAVQKFNKGTKIGQLTGGVQTVTISSKKYEIVEVLLTNPVKPTFLVTHYRLWFQSANLDIVAETPPKPNLPVKVVQKAQAKVATKTAAKPTTTTKPTTPTVVDGKGSGYEDYYDEVPESQSIYPQIGGILLLAIGLFVGFKAYKKYKKSKA